MRPGMPKRPVRSALSGFSGSTAVPKKPSPKMTAPPASELTRARFYSPYRIVCGFGTRYDRRAAAVSLRARVRYYRLT